MKFAHMGDCHLGGWRQSELSQLNFQHFQVALQQCIKERVEFILIAGDLFDTAYPPIETLKEVFAEFRKVHEAAIPVFIIAGSHDYSASGKTFLDVLEKSGFCKNVAVFEQRNDAIILQPTIHKNIAIYGYPGKKSGLEVQEIERIKLDDAPGFFKILMLHTTIRDAIGSLPIDAVDHTKLPKSDYLALSHLHINYAKPGRVYSGPIFPNNIAELEELQGGSFYIFDNGIAKRHEIKIKQVLVVEVEIKNALKATEDIITALQHEQMQDKIVILKISGEIAQGNITDIDFAKIEAQVKKQKAYVFLRSTSKLRIAEQGMKIDMLDTQNLEQEIISLFEQQNPGKFNVHIPHILRVLQAERIEDEKSAVFEQRLIEESRKVLPL